MNLQSFTPFIKCYLHHRFENQERIFPQSFGTISSILILINGWMLVSSLDQRFQINRVHEHEYKISGSESFTRWLAPGSELGASWSELE